MAAAIRVMGMSVSHPEVEGVAFVGACDLSLADCCVVALLSVLWASFADCALSSRDALRP